MTTMTSMTSKMVDPMMISTIRLSWAGLAVEASDRVLRYMALYLGVLQRSC